MVCLKIKRRVILSQNEKESFIYFPNKYWYVKLGIINRTYKSWVINGIPYSRIEGMGHIKGRYKKKWTQEEYNDFKFGRKPVH